jgi:hypothetical protein
VAKFASILEEVHGYKPVSSCLKTYAGTLKAGGLTALFDAAHNAVGSMASQAQALADQDFQANGIIFVITDGEDNASKGTTGDVAQAIEATRKAEALESLLPILIGVNVEDVNVGGAVDQALAQFARTSGFMPIPQKDPAGKPLLDAKGQPVTRPYLALADAQPGTIARLADFVSKSISSQADAQGTGGPSQAIHI